MRTGIAHTARGTLALGDGALTVAPMRLGIER
jgi:hypothetical protein